MINQEKLPINLLKLFDLLMLEKKEIRVLYDSETFSNMKKSVTIHRLDCQYYHLVNFLYYHLHQNDVSIFKTLKD